MDDLDEWNWERYLEDYPDLTDAGIRTIEDAKNHWLNHGSKEKRMRYMKDNHPETFPPDDEYAEGRYGRLETDKFIWISNPKCCYCTIRNSLVDNNIISDRFPKPSSDPLPKDKFSFTFVRNPYDRLVSGYCNKVKWGNEKGLFKHCWGKDFEYFARFVCSHSKDKMDNHIKPQYRIFGHFLDDISFVGRFESFSEDYHKVINILNLPIGEIPHRNKTKNRKHYSEYYSDEIRDMVTEFYKEDLETWDYKF